MINRKLLSRTKFLKLQKFLNDGGYELRETEKTGTTYFKIFKQDILQAFVTLTIDEILEYSWKDLIDELKLGLRYNAADSKFIEECNNLINLIVIADRKEKINTICKLDLS